MISSVLTFPLQPVQQAKLFLTVMMSLISGGALPSIRQPDIHHTYWKCTLTSFREELDVPILESTVHNSLVGSVE